MIIFLFGEDTYQSRRQLKKNKDQFLIKDKSGLNLFCFDNKKLEIEKIKEAMQAGSFFGDKKMIVVENIFKAKKEIKYELEKLIKDGISKDIELIIWEEGMPDKRTGLYKKLQKVNKVEQYDLLSDYKLNQWVEDEVKTRGGLIDKKATEKLASSVGSNLWQMDREIDKLIAFSLVGEGGKKQISIEDIDLLVESKLDDNIFQFTDALSSGNKALSLKLLHEQLELGQNVFYLLSMMNFQFRNLIRVKSLMGGKLNQYEIAKQAKMHPYVVQKSMTAAENFDLEKLKKIYNGLVEMERGMKRGQVEPVLVLDKFVCGL